MMLKFLTLTTMLLLIRCSSSQVAGGDVTETGNARASARVVDLDGHPVANATVRLRCSDYVTAVPTLAKSALYGADALTDSNGRFEINGIDPGSYRIEVIDTSIAPGQRGAVLFDCTLEAGDTADLGADTLRPFAAITGTIDTTARNAPTMYVQVAGLERLFAIGIDGRYMLANLPAGLFSLRIVPSAPSPAPVIIDSVFAISGDTALAPSALPAPWQSASIGETPRGSAAYANGTFSIAGGGFDIWGSADGFHFVYQQMTGDCQITAQLIGHENSVLYAKAGLMIREDLTAGSRNAALIQEISYPIGNPPIAAFYHRTALGDSIRQPINIVDSIATPVWLRIVRTGDVLSAFVAADSTLWRSVGSDTLPMAASVYVGLVATVRDTATLNLATFDGVSAR
jgi:regulation of enolase protein 1 (concanavalin A-like superfamily)